MSKKLVLSTLISVVTFLGNSSVCSAVGIPSDAELIAQCRSKLAFDRKIDDEAVEEDVFQCALDLKDLYLSKRENHSDQSQKERFNRPKPNNSN